MNRKGVLVVIVMFLAAIVLALDQGGRDIKVEPSNPSPAQKPELVIQKGHSFPVHSVAFSPDGKTLASGSWDNTIKLWEVSSGRLLRTLEGHSSWVNSVSFSPDGKTLASGSEDKSVKLWEVSTGRLLRTLEGHSDTVLSTSFGPDGKTLASGSEDCTVKLWEVSTGRLLRTLEGHSDRVLSASFSPDGKTLASGSWDETIKLWEVSSGRLLQTLEGHSYHVNSISFSPDGKTLASGSSDKTVKLWEVSSGRILRTLKGHSDEVNSVSFSPDGKTLASGSSDKTVKLWEVSSGRLLRTLEGHSYWVNSVSFSPNGKTLASGSVDNTIKLWEVSSGRHLRTLEGHVYWVNSVSFSPNGKTLASGSVDKSVKLWEISSGRLLRTLEGHSSGVLSVSFSPDGKTLASGSGDNSVKLWEVSSGRLLQTLEGPPYHVYSVTFSPDGKTLAAAGCDKEEDYKCKTSTIKLWDFSSGIVLQTHEERFEPVFSVSFSPDGKTLAWGTGYKTIELWEFSSGPFLRTLEGHSGEVSSVSFSPDGKTLASGSSDKTVKLWEVSSGRILRTLEGHSDAVFSISFSPDGKTLASGSWDNTIKLWEVSSGRLLQTLEGHSFRVNSVSFKPDGKTLASGSMDTTIKFWNVKEGKLLCTLVPLDKEDWVSYTADSLFDTSENGKQYIGWTVGMKNYSFELFYDEFYRPGLFSRVISGEKIEGGRDLSRGFATPPEVTIASPKLGESLTKETVAVTVEAVDSGGGVRDMRLYHQGKLVAGTRDLGKATKAGDKASQTYEVPLMAGENIFRATAYSRDNIESYAYEVKIRSAIAGKKPNLFILAIGLNQYENPKFKLDYSRQDAESILKFLTTQEGKVYEKIYPKALYDEQATRKNILDTLKLPTRPEDVVVIYLAGHGVAIDGRYYFLPYELPDDKVESLTKFGVSQAEIIGTLTSVEARKVMILLDSCHSGAVVLGMRGLEEERATKLFSKTAGVHVFAAASYSQSALELSKLGHGLFTYTLLDGLGGKADENHDNTVLVSELSDFLPAAVKKIAEQWGKEQYPTVDMHGQDFSVSAY